MNCSKLTLTLFSAQLFDFLDQCAISSAKDRQSLPYSLLIFLQIVFYDDVCLSSDLVEFFCSVTDQSYSTNLRQQGLSRLKRKQCRI